MDDGQVETKRGQLYFSTEYVYDNRGRFLFVDGAWWFWTGMRWKRDTAQRTTAALVDIFNHTREKLPILSDPASVAKDLSACSTAGGVESILKLARGHPDMRLEEITQFDEDPWLLNLQNGTLDLRTLELRPHDPTDRLSMLGGGSLGSQDDAPTFLRFLEEILPEQETRTYVQRILGSALLGEVKSHAMPIFTGRGANGKGTLIEAVSVALGDYAKGQDVKLLLDTKRDKEYSLAQLRGVRFVPTQEPSTGMKFDTGTMKTLTGGDRITGRHPYGRPFEFRPSHTLVMATNREPDIEGGDDEAIWRRITLIPFSVQVAAERQDPDLGLKLSAEVDGILAWLVEGWKDYQGRGYRLDPPQTVTRATSDYRESQDPLGQFMEARCVLEEGSSVTTREFAMHFNRWLVAQAGSSLDPRAVGKLMTAKGYTSKKSNGVRRYPGLRLLDDPASTPSHLGKH